MSSFNKVILCGHLTRDPEIRFLAKGTAVGEFGIGVNRQWKDADGNKQQEVSFFNCAAFGKTAEVIGEYFRNGAAILIEGRLKQDQWEDKQSGQKRQAVKIIVEGFSFLGSKQEGDDAPRQSSGRATARPAPASSTAQPDAPEYDDVPF